MRIIRSRQETRERILQATERLLDQTSALKFQIRDVAKEAGVSASLIIQYFTSKNDLVFEAAVRRMLALGPQFPSAPTSLDAVLETFFASDMAVSHVLRDLLALSWWWSPREEQRVFEVIRPRLEAIQAALTRGGEAPSEARVQLVLTAYMSGLRCALVAGEGPEESMRRIKVLTSIAAAGS